jgi:hypothetical protein
MGRDLLSINPTYKVLSVQPLCIFLTLGFDCNDSQLLLTMGLDKRLRIFKSTSNCISIRVSASSKRRTLAIRIKNWSLWDLTAAAPSLIPRPYPPTVTGQSLCILLTMAVYCDNLQVLAHQVLCPTSILCSYETIRVSIDL